MSTSGSSDYTSVRTDILRRAYRILAKTSDNPDPTDENRLIECLQTFVKGIQSQHVHLWTREWSTITIYDGVADAYMNSDIIDVEKVFIRDSSGTDFQVEIIPFTQYLDIPTKTDAGRPTQLALDRQVIMRAYFYPVSDDTYDLHTLGIRKLEDFDNSSDDPDFPTMWIPLLVWGTVSEAGPEFGADQATQAYYDQRMSAWMKSLNSHDRETVTNDFVTGAF
jgi:hypothetical protein